jgi:hypothetical protein
MQSLSVADRFAQGLPRNQKPQLNLSAFDGA